MTSALYGIIDKFELTGKVDTIQQLGEGFINDTYTVTTHGNSDNYLLQQKNKNIFKFIPGMMDNIEKISNHIKRKVEVANGDPGREAMTLVKTKDGALFFQDEAGEYWAVCQFISGSLTIDKADTPELAYAGGKGIGKFQAMLADFSEPLIDTLPGFHNMRFRFEQWEKVISEDPVGRKKIMTEEIAWVNDRRKDMMEFWKMVEGGVIPQRITHNDTKISNVLFDDKGEVLCMIDLDTVLRSIVLNDFGDAIRSYANTGKEDDTVLNNVSMDIAIFSAFAKGYLSEALSFLSRVEIDNLAFSARFITFEQVLRFLMDYIDGDNYYQIQYEDHNLVRTRAQYKLLQSIEEQLPKMNEMIVQIVNENTI